MVGSLTGAVTSQRVTEVRDGERRRVGHPVCGARARARLTVRPTGRTGTKVGPSDPGVLGGGLSPPFTTWMGPRSTDQRYAGDNRLMTP